ncbi:MAG: ATP-dependent DNA helicase [Hungatella sp.]|nr:ATP-dependent DNA helicase [Hungatella sp.]
MDGRGRGKQDRAEKTVSISVRSLVEFVLRSGDLDNRQTAAGQRNAMEAGSRIHRKIQKSMGSSYRAEVTLKHVVEEGEFCIAVEGRADGIITEPGGVTIDEIKGVYMDIGRLEEPVGVHLAQAMCYGYIYCCDHNLDSIALQVTYCNLETEEIRRMKKDYSFEELKEWFEGLIHEYVKWARYLYQHGIRRDASLRELEFPYAYREGQRDLAVSVYRAVARRRNLFIQAPTGVGKTLSTVYPGLKAMGEGHVEKIFYLTAKTITRSVAEETFATLRDRGMYLRTVTITAKEKVCFLDSPRCNPVDCPYAKGHYDRVNDAVYEIIHREFGITREVVVRYAQEYQVCPFEFCLDITGWVDGVICDYNYVFDPNARLRRYFSEGMEGEYLFLVDEAHNLVSRGREMYSASLIKEDVLLARRVIKTRSARVARLLDRCNKQLLEMKRESEGYVIHESINHLATTLMTLFGEMEMFMDEHREFEDRDLVLDFYFRLRDFLTIFEGMDEAYRIYTELQGDGRFMVKLFCMNPAARLKACMDKGRATVFFSATLLPVTYYKELLSGNTEDYAVYAESPFPGRNRLLMVAGDVSSKYTRRNRREFEKVLFYIMDTAGQQRGNYMVFFPSYRYMNEILKLWEEREEETGERGFELLVQSSRMDEGEKEAFLEEFNGERKDTLVAFCVMGGIFSEGIDLKEDRLIGVMVVGTGLPMVCTEQEILRNYFDQKNGRGFDYAFQYPGMNKVMQAAGRVIRTMEDRGIILLMDDRFLRDEYQALFPREWRSYKVVNRRNVGKTVKEFWEGV